MKPAEVHVLEVQVHVDEGHLNGAKCIAKGSMDAKGAKSEGETAGGVATWALLERAARPVGCPTPTLP